MRSSIFVYLHDIFELDTADRAALAALSTRHTGEVVAAGNERSIHFVVVADLALLFQLASGGRTHLDVFRVTNLGGVQAEVASSVVVAGVGLSSAVLNGWVLVGWTEVGSLGVRLVAILTVVLSTDASAEVRVAESLVASIPHVRAVTWLVVDGSIVFINLDATATLVLEVECLVERVVLGIGFDGVLAACDGWNIRVTASAAVGVLVTLTLAALVELVSTCIVVGI